jgi:hypothetical protein
MNGAGLVGFMYCSILEHLRWQWVVSALEKVQTVQKRFRDNIFQGQRLPPSFDRALGELEVLLVNLVSQSANFLGGTYVGRPGFQRNFKTVYDPKTQTAWAERKNGNIKRQEMYASDPLDWCLYRLSQKPDNMNSHSHAFLLWFLEEHFRTSPPAERARVDEILYDQLSDLAGFNDILVSVRSHRPQNRALGLSELSDIESPWKYAAKRFGTEGNSPLWKKLPGMLMDDFYRAEWPSGEQNILWLERSQALHRGLNSFWTGLRAATAEAFKTAGMTTNVIEAGRHQCEL